VHLPAVADTHDVADSAAQLLHRVLHLRGGDVLATCRARARGRWELPGRGAQCTLHAAGAPPAVMMSSLMRPVMRRKPSSSICPKSPECSQPSASIVSMVACACAHTKVHVDVRVRIADDPAPVTKPSADVQTPRHPSRKQAPTNLGVLQVAHEHVAASHAHLALSTCASGRAANWGCTASCMATMIPSASLS